LGDRFATTMVTFLWMLPLPREETRWTSSTVLAPSGGEMNGER
jgi:hypothetical protein